MSDQELQKLAVYITECFCDALKSDSDLQDAVSHVIAQRTKPKEKYIKMSEAAKILGVSVSTLRHIKDNFSCVKSGSAKSSPILFKESCLMRDYETYLAQK